MAIEQAPQAAEPRTGKRVPTVLTVAVGVGLLALLAYGFLSPGHERPRPGDPAPDFSLLRFDGSRVSLSDLNGQIVVLNFWASWCSPCRQEAPEMQRAWDMIQDTGIVFLGVTFKDAENASRAFISEFGITYANGIDENGRISRAYGVVAVPETFVIDGRGNVVWFHAGAVRAETLIQQLEQLQGM